MPNIFKTAMIPRKFAENGVLPSGVQKTKKSVHFEEKNKFMFNYPKPHFN